MGHVVKTTFALSGLFLFLGSLIAGAIDTGAKAANEPPLKIAIDANYPPLTVVGPDGKAHGAIVEMWRLWSDTTGTPIEFVPSDWAGTLDAIRNGKADVHSGLFESAERAQWLDFSEPIHEIRTAVYFPAARQNLPPLSAMKGAKVGVIDEFMQEKFLAANYPDLELRTYRGGREAIIGLLNEEIDALVNEVPNVEAELARFGLRGVAKRSPENLLNNALHAGVRKGDKQLIEKINAGFSAIPTEKLAALDEQWFANPDDRFYRTTPRTVNLNDAERQWLKDHPVIRFAVTNFIRPIDIVSENGTYTGLNADLIALLNKKIGSQIVPEFFGEWHEVVDDAMAGKVDGVFSFSRTPEREQHILFTDPYAFDPVIVITRADRTDIKAVDDLHGKTVSAIAGRAFIEQIKKDVGPGTLRLFNRDTEAIAALLQGEVDAYVSTQIMFVNQQAQSFSPGLKIVVGRQSEGGSLRIGIHKSQPLLFSIVQKALEATTREELAAFRAKWLTPHEKGLPANLGLSDEERTWVADHPVIRIGVDTAYPPFEFVDDQGKYRGIAPEYLKLMGERLGIEFKVIPGLTWKQVVEGAKNRTLDMVPVITNSEERRKFLNFTSPYLIRISAFFTRKNFPSISNFADLSGKRLAYPTGYSEMAKIRKNYPSIEIIEVSNPLEALKAVASGKADATQGNLAVITYLLQENNLSNIKVAGPTDEEDTGLSMGVRKDWPEMIPILQKVLASITRKERQSIRNNWIPSTLVQREIDLVDLNDEERQWLKQQGSFNLGIDPAWTPFEFVDDGGVYSGISSDYIELASKRLNIKMTPQKGLSWSEVIEKARSGEIDILPAVARTPEREKFLNFTQPYTSFPVVITTRKDAPFVDSLAGLDGKKVGVVKGYYTQELIETHHNYINVVLFQSLAEGLKELSEGKIDAFVDNLLTITHEIDQSQLENLKIASPTKHKFDIAMAVRKGLPELVPILNKAIASIGERERASIINSWTAIRVSYGVDLKTIFMWAIPIGGTAFGIITFIILSNRRLGQEVSERKQAEEQLAEKEKLLSLALNNMTDGMYMLDKDMRYILFNERYLDMADIGEDVVQIGAPMENVVRTHAERGDYGDGDVGEIVRTRMSALASEQVIDTELEIDGGTSFIDVRKAHLSDGGAIVTISDITERKHAEKSLTDAYGVISDSINYASNIQRSVLPDGSLFSSLLSDYFVLWKPRDVVGGDMYWCRQWGDGLLIILGDCTGHGVPGAFMTLIATGALDNALSDVPPGQVASLTQRLHQLMQVTLGQHRQDGISNDGMELGLCYLGENMDELTFVGARFELYLMENGEISSIRGTKSGIGYRRISHTQEFEEHQIVNLENKTFFMTSDGIIDQIGGDRRRSFGKKRFKQLLLELNDKPLTSCKDALYQALIDYQGVENRRDDVAVIGFKI